jgi:hypothetical protein
MPESTEAALWRQRAEDALERALDELRSDEDAGAAVSLAAAYLRALYGESDDDELADLRYYERDREPECICPPALVSRGGFKSGCPVHA